MSNEVIPREEKKLTLEQRSLLRNDMGKKLISPLDTQRNNELDIYVNATTDEMKLLTKNKLIDICKHFKRPHSGQNKGGLIDQILKGPIETDEMTEQEVFMKKTFRVPLVDKDKAVWKRGSLIEDNVRSVMEGVVNGVGGELEDIWECGLLRNKTRHWNVTCNFA